MTRVTLREFSGDLDDCEAIVDWRNAPENSRAFPPQEPWTLIGQHNWYYEVYRHDPSLNLYFVEVGGQRVGTVGMSIKDGIGEMMWMMLGDKSLARHGYMRQGMRMLMEAYGLNYYWGRVMPGNEAGLRFQICNGFTVTGKTKDGMIFIERYFDGTWPE